MIARPTDVRNQCSGNVTACYIYNGNRLIAVRTSQVFHYFYHFDQSGSTILLTDRLGATANAYAYSPFGEILNSNVTVPNHFTFVGAYGVTDEGDGLYFMRNRYYDAMTGKFLQKDPSGFSGGSYNLYSYVGNNPVGRNDPAGLIANDFRSEGLKRLQEPGQSPSLLSTLAPSLGSTMAVGNMTYGFFNIFTNIATIAAMPEMEAGSVGVAIVKAALGTSRVESVFKNHQEYQKPDYNAEDTVKDAIDPNGTIRKVVNDIDNAPSSSLATSIAQFSHDRGASLWAPGPSDEY